MLLLLIGFCNINNCIALTLNPDSNYIDSDGRKQGYWNSCKSGLCSEAYYINDTLNGVFKSYYQNKKLSSFGVYNKGEMIGKWYYFDEKGRLLFEVSKIEKRGYIIKKENQIIKYTTKSYLKFYYLNGVCEKEGFAIYNDDVEMEIEEIGNWKYYDDKGKFINSKLQNALYTKKSK